MNLRPIAAATVLVLLSGCAGTASFNLPPPTGNATADLNSLANFTTADLDNAEAMANAQGDTIAAMCYPAIKRFVTEQQAALNGGSGMTVSGAVSAFQQARGAVKKGQALLSGGIPDYLLVGCAPLVVDVQNDVTGFIGQIAKLGVPIK